MEDKASKDQKSSEDFGDDIMKNIRDFMGFTKKAKIPNFPINKKIQKKLLKPYSSNKNQKNSEDKKDEKLTEEDKKTIKKIIYPSGIIKITKKNIKNQIIEEEIDYKDIKQKYINNIKDNLDKELIKLIENSFLLYNRRQIIRNIVKKPYSTKVLEEKLLLWKFYIKNRAKDEKALLVRKLLYFIGKFSEKVYSEFINIKEISKAYCLFLLKGKIDKTKDRNSIWYNSEQFYMINSILGYDTDGDPKEEKENPSYRDEMKAVLLLQRKVLNIKEELNGTGYGFVFLKELREIGDMYSNSSYIFKSIFNDCYDIFDDNKNIIILGNIDIFRILWNFFVDYFIDDSFVMNFLIELKYIFGAYRQDDIVKFMHDLVLYRWNTHNALNDIKKNLEKLLGPEEIYDEKEKVEKMDNIEDVMKYIEGDERPKKKKKKKKKKNENKINMINEIENEKCDIKIDNDDIDLDIDMDDNISLISEADSVLDSFKNDLIEETQFNSGNKIIPQLSSEFLSQFKK